MFQVPFTFDFLKVYHALSNKWNLVHLPPSKKKGSRILALGVEGE